MADYKLSELNSIDTIRSDDLLHVRVKKRPEMLGDEDRRMTYQDFLASFKLERFVQIAGSTMAGDLGIVKLLYGGKAVFDPTGSSEITIGDVLKTFRINANGLKLTIADASRSATVYHTLNKPSPNELGMRTNEENDARYSRLAVKNTFSSTQAILSDNEALIIKNTTQGMPIYISCQDADGSQRWYLGNDAFSRDSLVIKNVKYGVYLALLDGLLSVNKSLQIVGQVRPSDFSNLDARYFTQTVANQRFAQLTANNTFSGANTFSNYISVESNAAAILLKNKAINESLFILAKDIEDNNLWYIGKGDANDNITFYDYKGNTSLVFNSSGAAFNKTVKITGQVQPSDWTNIDSRYIPAGTLSNLAKLSDMNIFRSTQVILQDELSLQLRNTVQDNALYFAGYNADNVRRWYIGNGERENPSKLIIHNDKASTTIFMQDDFFLNKTVRINGQVQPSDWANIDARYYGKSETDSKYFWSASRGLVEETEGGVAWNQPSGIYLEGIETGWSNRLVLHLFTNTTASTPSAQLRFDYRNGGMWYRTARDANGFEIEWSRVYTSADKPTPSEIGAYTKAETDQKIAQAISDSTDLNKIYPVGIVTWFNSNVDPNTALPGLTWTYLNNGVGRTIRIAAANDSDVATTGGSDSVVLSVGNLPSHTHSFSATTSSFDYGVKETVVNGAHSHAVSGSTNSAGYHAHSISQGDNANVPNGRVASSNSAQTHVGWTEGNGAHTHSVSGSTDHGAEHAHAIAIGAHTHTVSGNTGGTGSGSAFSVTNQFYKLMAWVRTA